MNTGKKKNGCPMLLLVDTYAINVPSRVTKIDSVLHLWLKWQSITKQIYYCSRFPLWQVLTLNINYSINQSINQTSWYYLYVMALYGKFIRLLTVSHHLQISILLSGHHRTENIVVNSKFQFKQFL